MAYASLRNQRTLIEGRDRDRAVNKRYNLKSLFYFIVFFPATEARQGQILGR